MMPDINLTLKTPGSCFNYQTHIVNPKKQAMGIDLLMKKRVLMLGDDEVCILTLMIECLLPGLCTSWPVACLCLWHSGASA